MHTDIVAEKDQKIQIGRYTLNEYLNAAKEFHRNAGPGILVGGFMVDLGLKNLPQGEYFDIICETVSCLPDAVQLLTPCTTGNGWMKIMNFGKYAMAMYEKTGGEGIRIFLDTSKVRKWPEIHEWYYKLKPKKEQNYGKLIEKIKEAGHGLFSIKKIKVKPEFLPRDPHSDKIINCSICGEAIRYKGSDICLSCQGNGSYIEPGE